MINESGNEYELTADVFTDVAMFSELPDSVATEEPTETTILVEPPTDEFVFSDAPAPVEGAALTEYEQQLLGIVVAADYSPFGDAFMNTDGSWNQTLYEAAMAIWTELGEMGVDPSDYAAVATDWLVA